MNDAVYIPVSVCWNFMSQTHRDALGVLAGLTRVESCDLPFSWDYLPQTTQERLLRVMGEVTRGAPC